MTPGTVYLVGAGPGDPGLITRRGLDLIRSCDALVYDRLVAPELLHEAPDGAELVYAGKVPGAPEVGHVEQPAINALLISLALKGRSVVRLKGGDPFVFGRGGEEAIALAAHGIPFEVVPGVSAATSAPAAAGIPVTHRNVAASFAVVTAHRCRNARPADWAALARGIDTLVLLMGVAELPRAVEALVAAGRDPDEPAAAIERATLTGQRVVRASLSTIVDVARAEGIEPPATIVLGPVVALADLIAPRAAAVT